MKSIIISLLFLASHSAFAQVSNSSIWLLDINNAGGKIKLAKPKQIASGNGYHNQPSFSSDNKTIFYTEGPQATQTDIFKYNIKTNETTRFINTVVSEYSPTEVPDHSGISAVVVEPDKRQRLWEYPFSGATPFTLFPTIDSIGYFSWVDRHSLVAFKLGNKVDSNKLLLVSGEGKVKVLAQNIGRGLKVYGQSAFFIKKKDTINYIALTDLKGFKVFSKTPGNSEHSAIYKNYILMADGGVIYAAKITFNNKGVSEVSEFVAIQDLSIDGLKNITRIAVSPNGSKISLVTSY